MINISILCKNEILQKGIEFTEDVCFSGKYGQQIFNRPMEDGGTPINGLVYENYTNSTISYYCFYENGIKNGKFVEFYPSAKIKNFSIMKNGQIFGKAIEWFENGRVKSVKYCKYGVILSCNIWNEDGILIDEKLEPDEFEKKLINKYESI